MIPAGVVPEFRVWLAEVGRPSGKTAEQVYALWRDYCATCTNYDQSPVQSEFLRWYWVALAPAATPEPEAGA